MATKDTVSTIALGLVVGGPWPMKRAAVVLAVGVRPAGAARARRHPNRGGRRGVGVSSVAHALLLPGAWGYASFVFAPRGRAAPTPGCRLRELREELRFFRSGVCRGALTHR